MARLNLISIFYRFTAQVENSWVTFCKGTDLILLCFLSNLPFDCCNGFFQVAWQPFVAMGGPASFWCIVSHANQIGLENSKGSTINQWIVKLENEIDSHQSEICTTNCALLTACDVGSIACNEEPFNLVCFSVLEGYNVWWVILLGLECTLCLLGSRWNILKNKNLEIVHL